MKTVFTTLLIDQGKPRNLDQHILRLHQTAGLVKITVPHWKEQYLKRFLNNYDVSNGQWRLKIFLNEDNYSFELDPYEPKSNAYRLGIHPEKITTKPLKIHPYPRDAILQQGYDDVLTLSKESFILETAYANVFWKVGEQIFTPSPDLPLLFGITIQELQKKIDPFQYVYMSIEELPPHANLYLSNSLRGVQPVIGIADKQFPRDFSFEKKLSDRLK